MPFQNRVNPNGTMIAVDQRGTMMGNRGGRIHDPVTKTLLKRKWASKRWICCVLEFKNRQREVMGKSYTELFFLDEVTALAAGHRPCFECRRQDANRFSSLWQSCFGDRGGSKADQMDKRLHGERTAPKPDRDPVPWAHLQEGVIYRLGDVFLTVKDGQKFSWSPDGYKPFAKPEMDMFFQVTPPAIGRVLAAGYQPRWHPSIGG